MEERYGWNVKELRKKRESVLDIETPCDSFKMICLSSQTEFSWKILSNYLRKNKTDEITLCVRSGDSSTVYYRLCKGLVPPSNLKQETNVDSLAETELSLPLSDDIKDRNVSLMETESIPSTSWD